MNSRRIIFLLSFSIFLIRTEAHAQLPFSQDSAALHVYNLAEKIGSRPVGSQQEQRALQYALEKFREAGLPIVFIMDADVRNPSMAARITSLFNQWKKYDPKRQALMKAQLERIVAKEGISPGVFEIASKALKG